MFQREPRCTSTTAFSLPSNTNFLTDPFRYDYKQKRYRGTVAKRSFLISRFYEDSTPARKTNPETYTNTRQRKRATRPTYASDIYRNRWSSQRWSVAVREQPFVLIGCNEGRDGATKKPLKPRHSPRRSINDYTSERNDTATSRSCLFSRRRSSPEGPLRTRVCHDRASPGTLKSRCEKKEKTKRQREKSPPTRARTAAAKHRTLSVCTARKETKRGTIRTYPDCGSKRSTDEHKKCARGKMS